MKPFWGVFFITLIFLFAQTFADLNLPKYMADIVNVGIQQQGIEDKIPTALSQEDFAILTSNSTSENSDLLEFNYTLGGNENTSLDDLQVGDYNKEKLSQSKLFVFTGNTDKANIQNIRSAFGLAFTTKQYTSEGIALDEARELALKTDPMFIEQSLPISIAHLYEVIGVDLDHMQSNYITSTGIIMILISLLGGIASIFATFFAARIGAAFARNLRSDVFNKIESFTNEEFDKFSTASLITRTTNDISQMQHLVIMSIVMLCYAPIMAIGGVIMALTTAVSMGWIIVLAIICLLVTLITLLNMAMPKFKIMQSLIDKMNLVAREGLNGLLVVKAFGNENFEKERLDEANTTLSSVGLFINRIMSALFPMIMLIMNGVTVLIVWIGADRISESTLQVGDMIAFMQYALQIIMSFLMLAMMFVFIPRAAVSAERIMEVLETEPSIIDPISPSQISNESISTVEFRNVSYKYHEAENYALKNISFKALPGKVTAFIGSTGSGKSTIVNLIPRFYDATEGEILVYGVNVKDLSQNELRSHIGLVPQKNILFSGTISSNLQYGKELTFEEMEEIAKVSQSYDFINEKEKKYDTEISQGGSNVSGGQKQRLAIARALATNSDIYIFDDSFSALDFKTDANLRSRLKSRLTNETVIIVAQRINTIMDADEIFVIDNGEIVCSGTHKELLADCPEYLEIAISQLSEEEVKKSE